MQAFETELCIKFGHLGRCVALLSNEEQGQSPSRACATFDVAKVRLTMDRGSVASWERGLLVCSVSGKMKGGWKGGRNSANPCMARDYPQSNWRVVLEI
jgi:hypothetical protein